MKFGKILNNHKLIENFKKLKRIGTLMSWDIYFIDLMKDEINEQFYIQSWSNKIIENSKNYQLELIYNISKEQIILLLEGKITLKNVIETNLKVYIQQSQIYCYSGIKEIMKNKKLELTQELVQDFLINNKNNDMFFELTPLELKDIGLMPNENAKIELFDDLSLPLSLILLKNLQKNKIKLSEDFYLSKFTMQPKNRYGLDAYIEHALIYYITRKPTFHSTKLFEVYSFLERLFDEIENLDKYFFNEDFDLNFSFNSKNIFCIQKEFSINKKLIIYINTKSIKYLLISNDDVFEDIILFNSLIPENLLNFIKKLNQEVIHEQNKTVIY